MSDIKNGMTDHQALSLKNDMGTKAFVERLEVKSDNVKRTNEDLFAIGEFIHTQCDIKHLKEAIYIGSAAIHYYFMPNMKQLFNISQVDTLNRMDERIAAAGFRQLRGDAEEYYGRKRAKYRSGV